MNNRKIFFFVCIVIAVGALLLAFGFKQIWFGAALGLIVGLLGVIGWYSKQKGLSSWMINFFWLGILLLVTLGAFLDLNTLLLIAGVVGGLGAWDLIRFQKSLGRYLTSEEVLQLEKQHLRLLGATLLIGGILAVVAAVVRIQIGFFLALGLGVFLILALSMIIRYFTKRVGPVEPE